MTAVDYAAKAADTLAGSADIVRGKTDVPDAERVAALDFAARQAQAYALTAIALMMVNGELAVVTRQHTN